MTWRKYLSHSTDYNTVPRVSSRTRACSTHSNSKQLQWKKHNKQNIKVREESDLIHISNIEISVKIILSGCNWNKCIKKLLKKQGSSSNFNMLIVNYF